MTWNGHPLISSSGLQQPSQSSLLLPYSGIGELVPPRLPSASPLPHIPFNPPDFPCFHPIMQDSPQPIAMPAPPHLPLSNRPHPPRHRKTASRPHPPRSALNPVGRPKSVSSETKRLKPAFTTCLTYPEALPITSVPDPNEPSDLHRSQRRSKVEALTKLDRAGTPIQLSAGPTATSFIPAPQPSAGPSGPTPSRNPLHRPRVYNPPFSLDTVRTEAPRHPPSRTGTRLFGLEECPIFYPTPDEFRDPMAYIDSIGPTARPYGICKIVPPEGWRMPFSLETDTFRFKTRLQRLNSLEAASRAKVNFLEQLTMYHLQQGDSKVTIPVIDRKPIDLWQLRKEVNKIGGYDEVTRLKGWPVIAQKMGLHESYWPNIRSAYIRIILPFDTFAVRAKSTSASPLTPLASTTTNKPPGFVAESQTSPTRPGRMGGMRASAKSQTGAALYDVTKSVSPPGTGTSLPIDRVGSPISDGPVRPSSAGPGLLLSKIKVPGFSSRDGSESELSDEDPLPSSKLARRDRMADMYQKGEVSSLKGSF